MDEEYDDTELGRIADERIQSFQADSSQVEEFFSAQYLITTSQLENVTKLLTIKSSRRTLPTERNHDQRRPNHDHVLDQAKGTSHQLITLPTYHIIIMIIIITKIITIIIVIMAINYDNLAGCWHLPPLDHFAHIPHRRPLHRLSRQGVRSFVCLYIHHFLADWMMEIVCFEIHNFSPADTSGRKGCCLT